MKFAREPRSSGFGSFVGLAKGLENAHRFISPAFLLCVVESYRFGVTFFNEWSQNE